MEGQLPAGLYVGPWRVDPDADEIVADGRVVKLEPQQMRLLTMLAARPGQVVGTQELLDVIWRDLVVTPNSVYQAVAQLRRQLGDTAAEPTFIQTVHRKGYRLVAPVRRVAAAEPAPDPLPAPAAAPVADGPSPVTGPAVADKAMSRLPVQRRTLVAVAALGAAIAVGAGFVVRLRSTASANPLRLAVTPFRDRSGADDALARGLSTDLVRVLGRRSDVTVLAPDAAPLSASVGDADLAALGRRLGVDRLLSGEMSRSGAQVVLELRLVDAQTGDERWRRRFEQPSDAVASLPAAAGAGVVAALGLAATPAASAWTGPVEAYELYVLGENAWRAKTPEAFERARGYFQRGIVADPAYSRNYIGLAWAWLGQATSGAGLDLPQAVARATPLFDRALALEPDAAEALTGEALLNAFAGEADTARSLLARAIAAQPSYAQAHHTLGVVEFDAGWPERAIAHFSQAASLQPLSASPVERLGHAQVFAGQPEAAARSFRRAMTLEPRYPNGVWGLGVLGYATGDLVKAVDGYRQALALEPRRPYLWHELGWIFLDLERPDDAEAAFHRAAGLLPGADWLVVNAAYAAVLREASGPSTLATPARADEGEAFADVLMQQALAGTPPLDATLLERSLAMASARGASGLPVAWFVFQGWHRRLNLATAQSVVGQSAQAARSLDEVAGQLDGLARQGNRWHTLDLLRARVAGLRGRPSEALAALERAVAAGSRRRWWMQRDPAFRALQGDPRFVRLLSDLGQTLAAQRRQLGG